MTNKENREKRLERTSLWMRTINRDRWCDKNRFLTLSVFLRSRTVSRLLFFFFLLSCHWTTLGCLFSIVSLCCVSNDEKIFWSRGSDHRKEADQRGDAANMRMMKFHDSKTIENWKKKKKKKKNSCGNNLLRRHILLMYSMYVGDYGREPSVSRHIVFYVGVYEIIPTVTFASRRMIDWHD